jgi:hypothetical protein
VLRKQGSSAAILLGIVWMVGVAGIASGQSLAHVGPVDPTNGYPMWLEDGNGLTLELCTDEALCAFLRPDVLSALSFPDNWPDEVFWYTADAFMDTNSAETALMVIAIEGAFGGAGNVVDGQQVMFGRLRLRVGGLQPNSTYTITTPYEVITLDSDGGGLINFTDDRGFGAAPFDGVLTAGIGPFLTWDPAIAPAPPFGFIGDIGLEHEVVGSPNGTNFFRIEGLGVGTPGAANLCSDPTLGPDPVALTDCIETPLFALTGKLATRFGVTVDRADYSRSTAGTQVSVWASSAMDLDLRATVDGVTEFPMISELGSGRYFARFPLSNAQAIPTTMTVHNYSDLPVSTVSVPLRDLLRITQASFDAGTGTLVVRGTSSNSVDTTSMSIGFGASDPGGGTLDASGTLTITGLSVPPSKVTLESSGGGLVDAEVVVTGITPALLADAGVDLTAAPGATVTLDGSGSTGALSFSWSIASVLPAGTPISITSPNTAIASLALPIDPVQVTVQLTVTDGLGASSSDLMVITNVDGALPPIADAGANQTVNGGDLVQLQGSASGLFDGVLWTQIAGPTVSLSILQADGTLAAGGQTVLDPVFTFPAGSNVLAFLLMVTGPFGSDIATVTVESTVAATPTVGITQATYRTGKQEWRIQGISSVPGPGHTVTIYLGSTLGGTVIGSAVVDATGAFEVRERDSAVIPGPNPTISIESSLGATALGLAVPVAN